MPPPNHRDPMLRPCCLDDWQLVADVCSRSADWLARNAAQRPEYHEHSPNTSMLLKLKGVSAADEVGVEEEEEAVTVAAKFGSIDLPQPTQKTAFLFEEAYVAGFKPMLDLTPKVS